MKKRAQDQERRQLLTGDDPAFRQLVDREFSRLLGPGVRGRHVPRRVPVEVTRRAGAGRGTGRAVTALALHLHRREQAERSAPTLIVCPASLITTWEREVARFAPTTATHRYHGEGRHLHGLSADTIVITTYGTLRRDADTLAPESPTESPARSRVHGSPEASYALSDRRSDGGGHGSAARPGAGEGRQPARPRSLGSICSSPIYIDA